MITDEEIGSFLEHHGVRGMKWGVRRNKQTGVRPIAKTLNDSRLGKLSKRNVDRHNRQKSQGKVSTSEKIAVGLAVGLGVAATTAILAKRAHVPAKTLVVDLTHIDMEKIGTQGVAEILRNRGAFG